MAPRRASKTGAKSSQTAQQSEDTQITGPPPTGTDNSESDNSDEEASLQRQLEQAQKQAKLASMREMIAQQERLAIEANDRADNYRNPAKRTRVESPDETTHWSETHETPQNNTQGMDTDDSGDSDNPKNHRDPRYLQQELPVRTMGISPGTSQAIPKGKPPPQPPKEYLLRGSNLKEYTIWQTRIQNTFTRNPQYFVNDDVRVSEGVNWLSDDMLWKWNSHSAELRRQCTWREFLEFCLHQVDNPENMVREAHQKFTEARQRPWQSVREFTALLKQWEDRFTEPYTDGQRIEHLRTRVLTEVRSEADKHASEPKTFDAFVSFLQTVEDRLPNRRIG